MASNNQLAVVTAVKLYRMRFAPDVRFAIACTARWRWPLGFMSGESRIRGLSPQEAMRQTETPSGIPNVAQKFVTFFATCREAKMSSAIVTFVANAAPGSRIGMLLPSPSPLK